MAKTENHKILIASLAVVCILTAVLAVWVVTAPQPTGNSVADIKPVSAGYLEGKIYLVSTSARYGTYEQPSGHPMGVPVVNEGDPCFILNVTVRNDYNAQQRPPDSASFNDTGRAYICLTAKIYDQNGAQIQALDVTEPYLVPFNRPQHSLEYGETISFDIVLATSHRDIDHYEFQMLYIGSMPAP